MQRKWELYAGSMLKDIFVKSKARKPTAFEVLKGLTCTYAQISSVLYNNFRSKITNVGFDVGEMIKKIHESFKRDEESENAILSYGTPTCLNTFAYKNGILHQKLEKMSCKDVKKKRTSLYTEWSQRKSGKRIWEKFARFFFLSLRSFLCFWKNSK